MTSEGGGHLFYGVGSERCYILSTSIYMQGHTIDPLDPSPSVRGSQISESSVVLPLFSPLSLMRTLWVEFDLIIPKAFQGQGGNMGSTSDSPDFHGCCQYKMITNTQVQIQMLNFGTKLSLRASTGVG